MRVVFLFLAFTLTATAHCEANYVDSLRQKLQAEQSDSIRIYYCLVLSDYYAGFNPDSGIYYCNIALKEPSLVNYKNWHIDIYRELGWNYYAIGVYDSSEINYFRSLKLAYDYSDTLKMCYALGNLGTLYEAQGRYAESIKSATQSLKLAEKQNNYEVIAANLNGIGSVYNQQEDYDKAIRVFKRAYTINKQLNEEVSMGNNLGNLAVTYMWKKEYEAAIRHLKGAQKIFEKNNYQYGLQSVYDNFGVAYLEQANLLPNDETNKMHRDSLFQKASYFFLLAIQKAEEINDIVSLGTSKANLADIWITKALENPVFSSRVELLKKAEKYVLEGLAVDSSNYSLGDMSYKFSSLYEIYSALNQHEKALSAYKNYIICRDSVFSIDSKKRIIEQELSYEYEKQAATDSIKQQEERKLNQAKLEQEQSKRYMLYGGLSLLLLFLGVLFNRFRITQQQNKIIQQQRELVEEKNKEITDSINYAKRIQDAYLPPVEVLKHYFDNSFLLFQPKDIVSGDFYWFYSPKDESNFVYVAVADCTGHGVPGAIMSVICCNALNEAAITMKLREPGKILDEVRRIVIQNLKSSREGKQKDGMDISLIRVNTLNQHVQFAGANNPLWILKKDEQHITEVKGDKQPVGMFEQLMPFTTQTFQLQQGDQLYLFSDGFADQFGGEKGKKFKYANLKQLLIQHGKEAQDQQMNQLHNAFISWKGDLEQVDDVCLIGLQL